jgi:hypothetical protein
LKSISKYHIVAFFTPDKNRPFVAAPVRFGRSIFETGQIWPLVYENRPFVAASIYKRRINIKEESKEKKIT